MNELLQNKNVILVGPCKSLEQSNKGEYIDGFDVVVRVKKGYPIPNYRIKDLGSKTNILYSNLRMDNNTNNLNKSDIETLNNEKVILCYPQPLIKPYNHRYQLFKKKYPEQDIVLNKDTINYLDFKKHCGFEPTIMTFAIMDLLQFGLKKLVCIGFSFREYGYLNEYKTLEQDKESFQRTYINFKSHDLEKEKDYFFNLIEKDKRLEYIKL